MSENAVELLLGILSAVLSFAIGHRRGRKIHRSGDYLVYKKHDDD